MRVVILHFAADAQVSQRVDVTMQILGLSRAADTIIGDAQTRGVSGGEKRRVTIGVELVKGPNCLLLDEPTTGLDSTTALDVGEALRAISRSGTSDFSYPAMEIIISQENVYLLYVCYYRFRRFMFDLLVAYISD